MQVINFLVCWLLDTVDEPHYGFSPVSYTLSGFVGSLKGPVTQVGRPASDFGIDFLSVVICERLSPELSPEVWRWGTLMLLEFKMREI
jgi:hypothetical protein